MLSGSRKKKIKWNQKNNICLMVESVGRVDGLASMVPMGSLGGWLPRLGSLCLGPDGQGGQSGGLDGG